MPKPKALVERDTYEGRPVVVIKFDADDRRPFRFGPGKARRLLAAPTKSLRQMLQTVVSEADALDAAKVG